MRDIELSDRERDDLLYVCARLYNTQAAANRILDRIGFPRERRLSFTGISGLDAWSDIFFDLDNGILPGGAPYQRLLEASLRVYPSNAVLHSLGRRHGLVEPDRDEEPGDVAAASSPAAGPAAAEVVGRVGGAGPDGCHVVVMAGSEADRQRAETTLEGLGLGPHETWSTANGVCYRLGTADARAARRLLEGGGTGLDWTLIPAGADYPISSLFVSVFSERPQLGHAPAQRTVGTTGDEVADQYPRGFTGASRPTVADHVGEGGQPGQAQTRPGADVQDGGNLVRFQPGVGGITGGHVFISYVREDSAEADQLQGLLKDAGLHVWRDKDKLWPGDNWRRRIRSAITDDALVFLACFSGRSLARRTSYQNVELAVAVEQLRLRRPDEPWLIPVRFDDCDLPDLDIGGGDTLRSIHRVDLFGDRVDHEAARLIEAIRRILASPGPWS